MDCQFGSHYYKDKSTGKRTCLQGTRKRGCAAHIEVHVISLFPEYKLSFSDGMTGVKKVKDIKQKKLQKLKNNLAEPTSTVSSESCYFVVLPKEEAHSHDIDGPALYGQRIHPKLVSKIYELVTEGITNVQEVKNHLKCYVLHVLYVHQRPDLTDRAYFPNTSDVRNHVYLVQRACQLSKFDQENLRLKIKHWKQDNPTALYFYRPFISSEDTSSSSEDNSNQTLLFVHQEAWQQDLLSKYGNTISLMDATYKTTKYEIALFFVTVKTNVGYKCSGRLCGAIRVKGEHFRSPQSVAFVEPKLESTFSDAEIGAIEAVFPSCKVYICDFHREQCWERWVKDRKHGLASSEADTLLSFLRDIANSPSPTSPDLSVDYHDQKHVDSLKSGNIWKNNLQLREWIENKWLSCPQVSTLVK